MSRGRLGGTLTIQLTTAQEDQPHWYPPYEQKENDMNLFNNEKGREIAYGSGLLWQLVKTALENGELRYLKPLGGAQHECQANSSSGLPPTNQ